VAAEVAEFELFYSSHRAGALRLAHLLTGSAGIGQEVVQDAFVAVHTNWQQIDNPGAYLRVAVLNRSRSVQRRQMRERHHLRRYVEPVTDLPEYDATWQLIRRLPVDQRAAIVLRFYEDLPIAEIATAMGKPTGTVKSLLHRGLARLKASIE
jgi:RNA polymerase sigma factor (sigma-70 family)